jgi:hypothetical protein
MRIEATNYSAGDKSSLSRVTVPADWQQTAVALPGYSVIKVSPGEVVLSYSLIKFRAGDPGDYIGVAVMGTPNHVPWVWCESVVTFMPPNTVVLYGTGSTFPSHSFYCQGQQRAKIDLSLDRATLRDVFTRGKKSELNTIVSGYGEYARLVLLGINSQSPLEETTQAGQSIPEQAFTAPANGTIIRVAIPLPFVPLPMPAPTHHAKIVTQHYAE